ncbi:MAG: translocation/assembly module TamB domain-containing protein, partial [Rhodospirillales bacterium]|nr:translocation/assembly module TamB domain-containing protein [Rhodospirillales bacterium]
SGLVHVTALEAHGIHIDRAPIGGGEKETEPESGGTGLEIPSLPVAIRVDRLEVADLSLGEALIGEAMTLRIDGKLAAPLDEAIRTELAIRRTDGGDSDIALTGSFNPSTENLVVDAKAREPAGGLVMRLAGLQPYPPFSLDVTGSGPLAEWQGKMSVTAEGLFAVDGEMVIQQSDDLLFGLDGRAHVTGMVEEGMRPAIGETVPFEVRVRHKDSLLTIETLDAKTAAIGLKGKGHLDLETEEFKANLSLNALDPERLSTLMAPTSLKRLDVDVEAAGDISFPSASVRAMVGEVTTPGIAIGMVEVSADLKPDPDARATEAGMPHRLDVTVAASGFSADDPATAVLTGDTPAFLVRGVLDPVFEAIDVETIEVKGDALRVNGQGRLAFAGGESDFALTGGIDDLSRLGDAMEMPLKGSLGLEASTRGDLAASRLGGKAAVRLAGFSMGEPVVDALLGPSAAITTTIAMDGEDTFTVEALKLDAATFNVTGDARITHGFETLAAKAKLVVDDLAPIGDAVESPMTGNLVADLTADGALADPTIALVTVLGEASAAGIAIPSAEVRVTAANAVSRPEGRLDVVADTSLSPIKAGTRFAMEDGERLRLSEILANAFGIDLTGELVAPLAGGSLVGDIKAAFRGGDEGVTVSGMKALGSADLKLRLHDEGGLQAAVLRLDGSSLVVVPEGGEAVRIGKINAEGSATDVLGTPKGKLSLKGADIGTNAFAVKTLDAGVTGGASDAQFQVSTELADNPGGNVRLRGAMVSANDEIRVTLNNLDGTVAEIPFALQRPAQVAAKGEAIRARDIALKVSDGLITLNADHAPAEKTARLRIADLPLSLAKAASPGLVLRGALNADADILTEGSQLGGTLALRVTSFGYGDEALAEVPPLNADLDARWSRGVVTADGRVRGIGDSDLALTGRVPLRVDARSLAVDLKDNAPLSATVDWQGALGPLVAALPIDGHQVSGQGTINLDVAGTIAAPRIEGDVTINGGRYENLEYGTVLDALNAVVRIEPNQIINATLSGTDGGRGRLSGKGRIPLDKRAGKMDVSLDFQNATLVRRDDVTAAASGEIRFVEGARNKLEGRIKPTRIEARLVNRMPPSVVDLDPVEIGKNGQVISAKPAKNAEAAVPLDLDLTIDMPGDVYVRGRGLDSEWKGNLTVNGPASEPRVKGKIEIVRGNFSFVGKRFKLTKGDVEFSGGRKIDPRLNVVAEHSGNDITGVISVTGLASDPQISLSSVPGLPESEILPRVLFGKAADELGPAEAVQIALALDNLRSGEGGMVDASRGLLGVDMLSIDPGSGDGGSAIRAGKNIGDRIYLETKQGTKPGTVKYSAEVKITDQLSLEAELSEGTSETKEFIGLKWQYDY